MIRFIRIKAYDTFSYKKLDFEFRTGLSAIEGLNGSSKSSVFMTLCQGLFNRNPKGCRVDEVNNYITQKPYEIEIEFQKGDDDYVVANSRKEGKITVLRNSKDISLKRVPENLALISEILGTDYSTFVDLVYQSKDSTLNILETTTDKGRKEFLARVLRLDEIDAQQVRLKEKEKDLAGKNGRINLLTTQISTLETSLGALMSEGEEYDLASLEEELQKGNLEASNLTKEVMRLTNEVSSIEKEIDAWKAEQNLRTQLANLEEAFDPSLIGNAEELQSSADNAASEVAKVSAALEVLKLKVAQIEKYSVVRGKVEAAEAVLVLTPVPVMSYEDCKTQKDKINKARSARKNNLDISVAQLVKFEAAQCAGVCPTCGGSADVSAQIKELELSIIEDQAFVDKCETSYKKYSTWIKEWETYTTADTTLQKLLAELTNAPDCDSATASRELQTINLNCIEAEATLKAARRTRQISADQSLKKLAIMELKAAITKESICPVVPEGVSTDLRLLKTAQVTLEKDLDVLTTAIRVQTNDNAKVRATKELNKQITENNQKITLQVDQFRKDLADCESKLELLKLWQGILGSKGYRVARIKKFVSSLNQLMVKYAQMISGGRIKCNFFITETGEIDFTITDEAKEMSYELWSGGEKARVKLVCLFAVLELLESMGSLSFNVLALDEVFDQLDSDGKEGLFNVLTYLKGRSKAIYTIAHSDLVLDLVYDFKVKATKLQDGTTEVGYV